MATWLCLTIRHYYDLIKLISVIGINHQFTFKNSWHINFSSYESRHPHGKWARKQQSELMTHNVTESLRDEEGKWREEKSERDQSGLSLCSWQGVIWYMSKEKRWRPGTPKRRAPCAPCSQASFTTVTLSQTHFSFHHALLQNNRSTMRNKAISQSSLWIFVKSKFHRIVIPFCMANLE